MLVREGHGGMTATDPFKMDELTPAQRVRLYTAALLLIELLENPNASIELAAQASDADSAEEMSQSNRDQPRGVRPANKDSPNFRRRQFERVWRNNDSPNSVV